MTARPPLSLPGRILAVGGVALGLAVATAMANFTGPLQAHLPTVDGSTAALPAPAAPPEPVTEALPEIPASDGLATWLKWFALILVIVLAAALVAYVVRLAQRRRPRTPHVGSLASPAGGGQTDLASISGAAEADQADPRSFQPRVAASDIIASWRAVEEAAAAWGRARSESSTPTEFLAGMTRELGAPSIDFAADSSVGPAVLAELDGLGLHSAASVLLHFYHRARFDTSRLEPGAATAARAGAHRLLRAWQEERRRHADRQPDARVGSAGEAAP